VIRAWEARVLHWLRVPPEPHPPAGSPGSLQVFRAGRNYMRLRLVVWVATQAGAVFGVLASLVFIREMEIQIELERVRAERAAASAPAAPGPDAAAAAGESAPADPVVSSSSAPAAAAEPASTPAPASVSAPDAASEPAIHRGPLHRALYAIAPGWLRELPRRIPAGALFWIKLAETLGIIGFAVQLPGSLAVVLLDYRQRWYMVTDRSLRLRWGVFNVHEATMSFANLQQVAVHQGPLERVLGLWDVEVESAGGGGGKPDEDEKDSMHRAVFHGVENGAEIRDIILARLRHFREAGLGDPDDVQSPAAPAAASVAAPSPDDPADAVQAAREVLTEVRALRSQL